MDDAAPLLRLSPQQQSVINALGHANEISYLDIQITGDVEVNKLRQACFDVVSEHEVFYTRYLTQAGVKGLWQQPMSNEPDLSTMPWMEEDFSELDTTKQQEKREQHFAAMASKGISIENGPLFHFQLVRLSNTHFHLYFFAANLLVDTLSLFRLYDAICDIYSALLKQTDVLQYSQFSEWLYSLSDEDDAHQGEQFWQDSMSSWQQGSHLSYERVDSHLQEDVTARYEKQLDSDTFATIKKLAEEQELSIEAVLLTAWSGLLSSLLNTNNILLGWEHDCRDDYQEMATALGRYIRTLPLLVKLDPALDMRAQITNVSGLMNDAKEWQEYVPLEIDKQSCAKYGFHHTNIPSARYANEVVFSVNRHQSMTDKFKLSLTTLSSESGLSLHFVYQVAFFPESAMEYLLEQYIVLLQKIATQPDISLNQISLVGDKEKQALLGFNPSSLDYLANNVLELFSQQAKKTPDSLALVAQDDTLTYSQLEHRANQLAHYLIGRGVRPESRVAICLERDSHYIISILAILKAGGAYIPLDVHQPIRRLQYIIEDAQPLLVLGNDASMAEIADKKNIDFITIESISSALSTYPKQYQHTHISPRQAAYVIYTSGTTGKPKGVVIEHKQLANYTQTAMLSMDLPKSANYALTSTLIADLGNTLLFPCLMNGSCLHLVPNTLVTDANAFATYCQQHAIDCMKIVPSHFEALLEGDDEQLKAIIPKSHLIFGGESCSTGLITRIQALSTQVRIFNHYGPTETTVGVMYYPLSTDVSHIEEANLPLSAPFPNSQIYILDSTLSLAPIGSIGEVYISGENVTRGYYHQPGLTAIHYIPNPFSSQGERLYRTGDLACYLPNGTVVIKGRVDHQVKINGNRIELDEVAAVLASHEKIKQAVAIVVGQMPRQQLVVYYVGLSASDNPDPEQLREYLQAYLPAYMVPKLYIPLKQLPLNANGKVERKNLPDYRAYQQQRTIVAPRNDIEACIALIWQELLGTNEVGVTQDFFELGGHSLLAIKSVARIQKMLQVTLPPGILFEAPTIEALSSVLVNYEAEPGKTAAVARLRLKLQGMSEEERKQLKAKKLEECA